MFGLLVLCGCGSTYRLQYAEVNSPNLKLQEEGFIYTNDSIKIMYSFWGNRGPIQVSIYNEMNTPVYIDWNRSSLIMNEMKLSYWLDKTETSGGSNSKSTTFKGYTFYPSLVSITANTSYSTSIKDERISFIPPKSFIFIDKFDLVPTGNFGLEKTTLREKKREVNIDYKSAKFRFRNFLTYSIKEDMTNERYVDNEFYVSKIGQFDEYFHSDPLEKQNIVTNNLKGLPNTFYILIPITKE